MMKGDTQKKTIAEKRMDFEMSQAAAKKAAISQGGF